MTDLSPAAQAVLDAYAEHNGGIETVLLYERQAVAAVLRAAADQMGSHQSKKFLYSIADAMKLRGIAAELEGSHD
jgi:hypothetical protein